MKFKFLQMAVAGVVLSFISFANAELITVSELQTQDVDGQNFNFSLNGLDSSNGTGGTFTIHARGDFNDRNSQDNETLSWDIESIFSASGIGGFNQAVVGQGGPFTDVIVHDGIYRFRNIEFTRTWSISAFDLDNILSDSVFGVFVDFASGVDAYATSEVGAAEPTAYVEVIISYDSITPVPVPSNIAIFALGLMGLGARRFKKQA
jgi:hypothetical protein